MILFELRIIFLGVMIYTRVQKYSKLSSHKNYFCIDLIYLNQMVYWHYFDKIGHLHRGIVAVEILLDDPNKQDRYARYGNPKEPWYPIIIIIIKIHWLIKLFVRDIITCDTCLGYIISVQNYIFCSLMRYSKRCQDQKSLYLNATINCL